MGLIKYRDELEARGEGWLWPEVGTDARGYRSDLAQKWFSRLMDKAGVRRPRVSFHSARHLWRDKMAEVGAPLDLVRYMGGWAGSNVSEHYGGQPSPKVLARWVRRVRYDGLDLGHLAAAPAPRKRLRRR